MKNKYSKLRPEPPTPANELCTCREIKEIYLAHKLGSNPIHCLQCNKEIAPGKIKFGEIIAEQIAYWNKLYGALYTLWLYSGQYERWAKNNLLNPKGQVNKEGLEINLTLNNYIKSYYLWFRENYDYEPQKCPLCTGRLIKGKRIQFKLCKKCHILI